MVALLKKTDSPRLAGPARRPPSSWRWAAGLALLTFLLFAPALRFGQVGYDDGVYVFENPQVFQGLSLTGVNYAFRSIDGGSWMPLTWLSLMLDTTLFGVAPWGYHFTNILLHAICAGLLFRLLHGLTGRVGLSLFIAGAFALHPMRTESVVWIAERKDVLSGVFWMWGLLAYLRYAKHPSRPRFLAVLGLLIAGLMTKPMAVTFPFVLLLLDLWPLSRAGKNWSELVSRLGRLVREKAGLFLIVAIFCGLTYWAQARTGAVGHPQWSVWEGVGRIAENYGFYLQKTFWPADRTVVYPESSATVSEMLLWSVMLLVISALAVWQLFRKPWFAVGWFWFMGTLVPVIGVVRVGLSPVADRYTYLPSIGIFLLLAFGVYHWLDANNRRRWFLRGLGGVAILVMAVTTWNDLPRWRDAGSLFGAAVQVCPTKVSLNNLAYFQIGKGDPQQAIKHCDHAIRLAPIYAQSYATRSLAYAWQDDYEQSKRDYNQAVSLGARPIQPERLRLLNPATSNLPIFEPKTPEEAWHYFAAVFKLEPRSAGSFCERADFRFKWNDLAGALRDYNQAIQLEPGNATFHSHRGNVHLKLNHEVAALADMTRAIELTPTNAASYQNRAVIHFKARDFAKAWADIEQCRKHGGTPPESFLRALTEASGRSF